MPLRLLALATVLIAPAVAPAQGAPEAAGEATFTIAVEAPDGSPLVGAAVRLGVRGATTDADGRATFDGVRPGRHLVRVSYVGRETRHLAARLEGAGPWALAVEADAVTGQLGEVVVEAEDLRSSRLYTDGVFRRLATTGGTFLTADVLEARGARVLTDALRGVLGVFVRPSATGPVAVSTRANARCPLSVFVDGLSAPIATYNLDALTLQDVVAVEVYRGPSQTPLRYTRLGETPGCGAILVWTSMSLATAT